MNHTCPRETCRAEIGRAYEWTDYGKVYACPCCDQLYEVDDLDDDWEGNITGGTTECVERVTRYYWYRHETEVKLTAVKGIQVGGYFTPNRPDKDPMQGKSEQLIHSAEDEQSAYWKAAKDLEKQIAQQVRMLGNMQAAQDDAVRKFQRAQESEKQGFTV